MDSSIRHSTQSFLDKVERSAQRKLQFRREVALLMELAASHSLTEVFDELAFHAKFVTKAYGVLRRTDSASEETQRLSAEIQNGLNQVVTLFRSLIVNAEPIEGASLRERFLSTSHDGLTNLLALLNELSWVKDYTLDQRNATQQSMRRGTG